MISMEVYMDILTLHRQGLSQRIIAKKLGIHRNTVKKYIHLQKTPSYRKNRRKSSILDPFKPMIKSFLEHDDYRATWIFDRICAAGYKGSYDTVKPYVRNVKQTLNRIAYTRFETNPGFQAQVDWADFQIAESNGGTTSVYAFVMVLGFSRAMYVELVPRCTLETFMDCHIRAFYYLKGVPAEILYDNMRQVVIVDKKGSPRFNMEFLHFAHHYGFTPRRCPAYSPWVKGKVERPVDYIRQRFWRGYSFDNIEQANRDLLYWLKAKANVRVHGTYHQPIFERWAQEVSQLGKMPAADYDTSIKVFRKVYKDCQISFECNRYILPHHVVGKIILLKIKNGMIRFYDDDQLLVTYRKFPGKHQVVGDRQFYENLKADMSQHQRKYGRSKGKATRGLVTGSLYPEVASRPLSVYDQLTHGGASWNN